MLDKEKSEKLQAAALARLTKTLPNNSSADHLTKTILELAVMATIVTLEEYEKMNQ